MRGRLSAMVYFQTLRRSSGGSLGKWWKVSFELGLLDCCHGGVGKCFRGLRGETLGTARACQWSIGGLLIHVVADGADHRQYPEYLMSIA